MTKHDDETSRRAGGVFVVAGLCLLGFPLLGVYLDGQSLSRYAEFPPRTRYVGHASFSWTAFVLLAAFCVAVVTPFVLRVIRSRYQARPAPARRYPFPVWGWLGVALIGIAWPITWCQLGDATIPSSFPGFSVSLLYTLLTRLLRSARTFTFTPLWLGYVLVVNALTYRRAGHCMLSDRPRYFLLLFAASACFWWVFEYLNRFVQNWYYVGVEHLNPLQYFLVGTLPFSTVLPATMSTHELLNTFPGLTQGLDEFPPITVRHPRLLAWSVLTIACAGLTGIGVWPDYLFPLLWLSPLFIITCLQALGGRPTIFTPIAQGDWSRICRLALATLICGLFWEMWNINSLPKWVYSVPFVDRFHVFEMPILGFAGYLPFGLECAVIAHFVRGPSE